MPEFLRAASAGTSDPVAVIVFRLFVAMVLGGVVALVYRKTRAVSPSSFTATLVLLSILIAMVTQVIGDNVARAFSLVGALSIVRFRTVVRDTQDTAYVIGAVAVGMAVGAGHFVVAAAGIGVVTVAAFAMREDAAAAAPAEELPFALTVRLALGLDASNVLGPTLAEHARVYRLFSVATAKQGAALELGYRVDLLTPASVQALVTGLNRLEGVQSVNVSRLDLPVDA